ncbi:MAG TPA: type II secretion system F family protein [Gammaproteobacteria bacterium]|nr:type II secretion system F family protein [Gammaproteobacteria bacterium]
MEAILKQLDLLMQALPGGPATLALMLVFVAVFLAVVGIASLFGRDPVRRRLAGAAPQPSAREQRNGAVPQLRAVQDRESKWDDLLKPLEKYFVDQKEGAEGNVRQRMLQAGFVGPNAVRNFFLIRTILAIGAPALFLMLLPSLGSDMSVKKTIIVTFGFGLAGLYLPGIWISSRIDRRQAKISEAFPDALDMMVVCVEAGLGLDAAFTRVGTQIAHAHPLLAQELGLVSLELRAGKSREDALRNFARRVGLREVKSFVTLLIQSDQLGTSVAQTLRVHAAEMRTNRMLRAEEKAHKLPVKLVIPLVTCVLPAMVAVVLLPGMIRIIRIIMPGLG